MESKSSTTTNTSTSRRVALPRRPSRRRRYRRVATNRRRQGFWKWIFPMLMMLPVATMGFQIVPLTKQRAVAFFPRRYALPTDHLQQVTSMTSDAATMNRLPESSPIILTTMSSSIPTLSLAWLESWQHMASSLLSAIGPLQFLLAAVVLIAVAAVVQGAAAVVRFRSNFSHAPMPMIPAHGLVVVNAKTNHDGSADSNDHMRQQSPVENPNDDNALRLLVIGDSLAVGVGQADSCTPVLPEQVAKVLAQSTHRPVYWTCCGESGASTRWILRMLQEKESNATLSNETTAMMAATEKNTTSTNGYDDYVAHGLLVDDSSSNQQHHDMLHAWKRKLHDYQECFDPTSLGSYDIVVIITGANDLKGMLFPFLLLDEDKELLKQGNKGGGLIEDLTSLMNLLTMRAQESMRELNAQMELRMQELNAQMELRMQESMQSIRESADAVTELMLWKDNYDGAGQMPFSLFSARDDAVHNETASWRNWRQQQQRRQQESNNTFGMMLDANDGNNSTTTTNMTAPTSLFVLPGMPARALPTFRSPPLRWFAIPVIERMDKKKQKLATGPNGDSIMFVAEPSLDNVLEYEKQQGDIWETASDTNGPEQMLLSLRAVSKDECQQITSQMSKHYGPETVKLARGHVDDDDDWDDLHLTSAQAAERLFSPDRIHPNDSGYRFWGTSIGMEVAAKWKQEKKDDDDEMMTTTTTARESVV